jgi:hypothetical protein
MTLPYLFLVRIPFFPGIFKDSKMAPKFSTGNKAFLVKFVTDKKNFSVGNPIIRKNSGESHPKKKTAQSPFIIYYTSSVMYMGLVEQLICNRKTFLFVLLTIEVKFYQLNV